MRVEIFRHELSGPSPRVKLILYDHNGLPIGLHEFVTGDWERYVYDWEPTIVDSVDVWADGVFIKRVGRWDSVPLVAVPA